MSYEIKKLPYMQRHWILNSANIPSRFMGLEPADIEGHKGTFPKGIDNWIDKVLEGKVIKRLGGLGDTGVGLLFDGSPGLGKTTHAVVTVMELIRRLPTDEAELRDIFGYTQDTLGVQSRPIYYMQYVEFLSRKKAMIDADPETKAKLHLEMEGLHGRLPTAQDHLNVRVLVLDDLGKEYKGAGFNDASFDEILRSRYDKALPTIITTNVDRELWTAKYGAAMGSFAYEAFKRIEITGEDMRK